MPVCLYDSGTRSCCTGQERDAETNLDFYGARYFGGAIGRFTGPDEPLVDQVAVNPQSWNLYSYGRYNPLRFIDPTGEKCVDTSNGKADDGMGGGCAAAGVDTNGNIQAQEVNVSAQAPGFLDQLMVAAVGHHGLPEWSKIPDSPAFRFFSRWFTGPLQNPQANYYDALHRLLNGAARKTVNDYLQTVGKQGIGDLTKEEVKQLAKQLLDSKAPGVQDFMTRLERLNPGATGTLRGLIDSIDIGSGLVFMVPGQEQLLNIRNCGLPTCGTAVY